jgi:TetR/AcrR family transcriptional regulator, transcriptional repressor of bet genes
MPKKKREPKFHRNTPAARREALIAATLRCLKKYGHEGVSIRRISAEAGVSIGLINHHFPSKSGLIAVSYETLALSLMHSTRALAEKVAGSARDRLSAFFEASFAPDLIDPDLFNVWLVFWSMVAHSPEIRAIHARTYAGYRRMLEALLAELGRSGGVQKFKLRQAAIGLSALLDGLWVELSLSPDTLKASTASALCEDWVDALCSGSFPRLLSKPRALKSDSIPA